MTMRGWTYILRPCAFLMKYSSIRSVTSKSAITPSFIGRIDSMLPGVRPSISLASLPDRLDAVGELVDDDDGRLAHDDALVAGENQGVGGAEVDGEVVRKVPEQGGKGHRPWVLLTCCRRRGASGAAGYDWLRQRQQHSTGFDEDAMPAVTVSLPQLSRARISMKLQPSLRKLDGLGEGAVGGHLDLLAVDLEAGAGLACGRRR